jgi:hypothetical protein
MHLLIFIELLNWITVIFDLILFQITIAVPVFQFYFFYSINIELLRQTEEFSFYSISYISLLSAIVFKKYSFGYEKKISRQTNEKHFLIVQIWLFYILSLYWSYLILSTQIKLVRYRTMCLLTILQLITSQQN